MNGMLPAIVVPQGVTEMKGIAHTMTDNTSGVRAEAELRSDGIPDSVVAERSRELEVRASVLGRKGNKLDWTLVGGA